MSNKNKTIALASLIAAGAGVAAVAASNSHKQAKAKKIAEKQQAESGTPYRNTERGKYEKNSKGIYYTNGNYEAFAHPKKPEGVDEKSAYIVGSGLASLAAACFLVRDGQMPGDHIHILEAMDIAGGACDGIFDPSRGYVMRGGREMENHFECLWDLFRSIPSIETPGVFRTRRILLAEQRRSELLFMPCNRKPWRRCTYGRQIQLKPERLHGDHETFHDQRRGSV